jgi:hypothetical protein
MPTHEKLEFLASVQFPNSIIIIVETWLDEPFPDSFICNFNSHYVHKSAPLQLKSTLKYVRDYKNVNYKYINDSPCTLNWQGIFHDCFERNVESYWTVFKYIFHIIIKCFIPLCQLSRKGKIWPLDLLRLHQTKCTLTRSYRRTRSPDVFVKYRQCQKQFRSCLSQFRFIKENTVHNSSSVNRFWPFVTIISVKTRA